MGMYDDGDMFDSYDQDEYDVHKVIDIKGIKSTTPLAVLFESKRGRHFWIPKEAIVSHDDEVLEYQSWFTIKYINGGFNNVSNNS